MRGAASSKVRAKEFVLFSNSLSVHYHYPPTSPPNLQTAICLAVRLMTIAGRVVCIILRQSLEVEKD
jgi:hypothetical protein